MSKWLVVTVVILGIIGFGVTVGAVNATGPETVVPVESAADVAAAAYTWYLDLQSAEVLLNPLLDGAYQNRADLSAGFIARLDAEVTAASGSGLTVDPFLCVTGELPQRVQVEQVQQADGVADVLIAGEFAGEQPPELAQYPLVDVELVIVDGQWQINDITCR